jgi:calcineurin-like phosphoesterase family protein
MNSFFTADNHFDHDSILRHCKRPWLQPGDLDDRGKWVSQEIADARLEAMNEAMVDIWNKKVPARDSVVYIAGDFAWRDPDRWLGRLHGKKILCIGNHDKKGLMTDKRSFTEVHQILERTICGKWMVICHYPFASWSGSVHGSWNLFGHCHMRYVPRPGFLQQDIGVDGHNFEPWDEGELFAVMTPKEEARQRMLAGETRRELMA